jgi:hypothetical protein
MTHEEIIEMARQAGLHIATDVNWMPIVGLEYAERFAKLVAEKEREAILGLADSLGWVSVDHIQSRGQS